MRFFPEKSASLNWNTSLPVFFYQSLHSAEKLQKNLSSIPSSTEVLVSLPHTYALGQTLDDTLTQPGPKLARLFHRRFAEAYAFAKTIGSFSQVPFALYFSSEATQESFQLKASEPLTLRLVLDDTSSSLGVSPEYVDALTKQLLFYKNGSVQRSSSLKKAAFEARESLDAPFYLFNRNFDWNFANKSSHTYLLLEAQLQPKNDFLSEVLSLFPVLDPITVKIYNQSGFEKRYTSVLP